MRQYSINQNSIGTERGENRTGKLRILIHRLGRVVMQAVIEDYQHRLHANAIMPTMSHGRSAAGSGGKPNYNFVFLVCCNKEMCVEFLKDCGLIKNAMECPTCRGNMTFQVEKEVPDGFTWRCRKRHNGRPRCNCRKSIRSSSWFAMSKLTLAEIILATYHVVSRKSLKDIHAELGLSQATLVDWASFCREDLHTMGDGQCNCDRWTGD